MTNLKIFVIVYLSIVTSALHGSIDLLVEQVGEDVVFSYSGSLDTFIADVDTSFNVTTVFHDGFLSLDGTASNRYNTGVSLVSGLWTDSQSVGGSTTGDSFGFSTSAVDIVGGYVQGETIAGSATFSNRDLVNGMGFTIGDSGTFTGGGNTINFSVVPEPASFSMLVGVAIVIYLWYGGRSQRGSLGNS